MNWMNVIGGFTFVLALLGVLGGLIIRRRDATIEAQDREINRLKNSLDEAKNASPDILAERYKKKIDRLESELKELLNESESDKIAIAAKELEIESVLNQVEELKQQMADAQKTLEQELEYLKEQLDVCPVCGAGLTEKSMHVTAVYGEYGEAEDAGEFVSYACGYAELEGNVEHPCANDPNFPTLDDYNLETEYQEQHSQWMCYARPKTEMAKLVRMRAQPGKTEEQARQRVIDGSKSYLKTKT